MTFDALVGVFLHPKDDRESHQDTWNETLGHLNAVLRRAGLPTHREPRSVAELARPLPDDLVPGSLGTRLGFYRDRKYQRLTELAQFVAVHGALPVATGPYLPDVEDEYDALPDRRKAFDHLIAATTIDTVLLPRPLDEVITVPGISDMFCRIASADRLLTESVALGYVLRHAESDGFDRSHADRTDNDSPVVDWVSGRRLDDLSFAHLDVRIGDDDATAEEWVNEADLCGRLALLATEVLRTGALGITG